MNAPSLAGHGVLLGCKSGDAVHVAIMRWLLEKLGDGFTPYSAKPTTLFLFPIGPNVRGPSSCQMSCALEFLPLVRAAGGLCLVFGDRRVQ